MLGYLPSPEETVTLFTYEGLYPYSVMQIHCCNTYLRGDYYYV